MTRDMNEDIEKVVFSEEELKKRVAELGKEITEDYKDAEETIYGVGILKCAVVFYSRLRYFSTAMARRRAARSRSSRTSTTT